MFLQKRWLALRGLHSIISQKTGLFLVYVAISAIERLNGYLAVSPTSEATRRNLGLEVLNLIGVE
jgi:hypothetical protein